MFPSLATDGLKVIFSFFTFAASFCYFLLGVRDRLSMFTLFDGLHLGFSLSISSCAALQHLFGSGHPVFLSASQLVHWHWVRSWWISFGLSCRSRLVVLRRSFTVLTWWFVFRHFGARERLKPTGLFSAPRWYHAGSSLLTSSGILRASKLRLYFLPTLIIFLRSGGSLDLAFRIGDHA